MKIVLAIDSFKGCLSSLEVEKAAREGIFCVNKDIDVVLKPMADGGEGTTEALVGENGHYEYVQVSNPLGEKIESKYGVIEDAVVLEMAKAAGIELLSPKELNPHIANTLGVGEMILDAINKGYRKFLMGIGGSATTECGIGMLYALGYKFLNEKGEALPPVFSSLSQVIAIDETGVNPLLKECSFKIACDVTNPLCGRNGAVYTFGPQKGVKKEELESFDKAVLSFANACDKHFNKSNIDAKGAGAAGGLGYSLMTFLEKTIFMPGVSLVMEATNLEAEIKNADLVITGEGRLDAQTVMGKLPVGVAELSKKYGCKVVAIAGSLADKAKVCNDHGIDAFFSIQNEPISLDKAIRPDVAYKNIRDTVEQIIRLIY